MKSINPYSGEIIWSGEPHTKQQINKALALLKTNFETNYSFADMALTLRKYQKILTENHAILSKAISEETGKMQWEADAEVTACINKIELSITAHSLRTPSIEQTTATSTNRILRKPIGVLAVFGPYNFPAHLPNGHIVPALLAGNSIAFKPSELTPKVGAMLVEYLYQAGISPQQLQLIQGEKTVGIELSQHKNIDGILFTGSYETGKALHQNYSGQIDKMLALELGGNNPLVIDAIADITDIDSAVYNSIMSAFISSGQRCTCARRLIVIKSKNSDIFLEKLIIATQQLKVGSYLDNPEPFLGPLISLQAAKNVVKSYKNLVKSGAKELVTMKQISANKPLLSAGLLAIPNNAKMAEIVDTEIFGPLLQVYTVDNLQQAIDLANATDYGLAAAIFTDNDKHWQLFQNQINAGIINRNQPTTGAKSDMPFGGIGNSGNFRPSGFYAAEYCSYPVASNSSKNLTMPDKLPSGLTIEN